MVAALAALLAVADGRQAALMAPTELLAEQHFNNLRGWLEPLGLRVCWLAGKVTGKARAKALAEVASGQAQLVVGTHALMQEGVDFHDLALAIVDEQHRFGVHQRLALRDKGRGSTPHQLVMTATPIPRTLAMSAYAARPARKAGRRIGCARSSMNPTKWWRRPRSPPSRPCRRPCPACAWRWCMGD